MSEVKCSSNDLFHCLLQKMSQQCTVFHQPCFCGLYGIRKLSNPEHLDLIYLTGASKQYLLDAVQMNPHQTIITHHVNSSGNLHHRKNGC